MTTLFKLDPADWQMADEAPSVAPLPVVAPKKPTIQSVKFQHEAIADLIVANPAISQGEIAAEMGYTQAWVSIIVNSDAFKEHLAERKAELVDPLLRASIQTRLDTLANRSLERLLERVDSQVPLKTTELIAMAKLGVDGLPAARAPVGQQNNLYVMNIPPAAESSKTWLSSAQGRHNPPGDVSDATILPGG